MRKLSLVGELPGNDIELLREISQTSKRISARSALIREGETPNDVRLILEGVALRCKITPEGRRQILAYLLPGDFCDLHVSMLKTMDHDIETLTPCLVAHLSRDRINRMLERPALVRALWWTTLIDEAILREWLVNMGQRRVEIRIAHFFCEMHLRLTAVGLASDQEVLFPITQTDLGDTLGASAVHINRSLQTLRQRDLLILKQGQLSILDLDGLRRFAGFNPNYLHIDGAKDNIACM